VTLRDKPSQKAQILVVTSAHSYWKEWDKWISTDYTHVHTRQRQQMYAYWQCYSEAQELEIDYGYNKGSSHMKVHHIGT